MNTQQRPIATRQEFGIHPSIIYTLITAQASGVEKALLELVMNSVDAQATRIDVELDETGFVIKDNGHGFENREKIENCFGILGFPHSEGDAYYGKFRLGRMQSFGYAKTTWHTKNFKIMVDLNIAPEIESYGYEIHEVPEFHQGCIITGEFYRKMPQCNPDISLVTDKVVSPYSIKNAILALAVSVKYLPVDIYINGERVNKRSNEVLPTAEIKTALFFTEDCSNNADKHSINVYNKGVYAFTLPSPLITGDVVSTVPIDLNMARNEAKSTCRVYRAICNKIEALKTEIMSGRKALNRSIGDDINKQQYARNFWCKLLEINGTTFESAKEFTGLLKYNWFETPANETISYLDIVSSMIKSLGSSFHSNFQIMKFYSAAEVNEYKISPSELDQISCINRFVPLEMMPSAEFLQYLPETLSFPIQWILDDVEYLSEETVNPEFFTIEIPQDLSLDQKCQKLMHLLVKVCGFLGLACSIEFEDSQKPYNTGIRELAYRLPVRYTNFGEVLQLNPDLISKDNAVRNGTYIRALTTLLISKVPYQLSLIDNLGEFKYEPVRISKPFFENLKSRINSQKELRLTPFQELVLVELKKVAKKIQYVESKKIENLGHAEQLSDEMLRSMALTHRKIYVVDLEDNVQGKTDSFNFILINRKYFVEYIKNNDYAKLYYLVLHEMAHGMESQSHVHGEVFYSKFHESLIQFGNDFGSFEASLLDQVLVGRNFKTKKAFERYGASKSNVEYFLRKHIKSVVAMVE